MNDKMQDDSPAGKVASSLRLNKKRPEKLPACKSCIPDGFKIHTGSYLP
jgi:hypothetical protein